MVRSGAGNVLVFILGMDEIQRLRTMLKKVMKSNGAPIQIMTLHSDCLGLGEDEQKHEVQDVRRNRTLVILSSVIAARGVTLPNIKYVFIHPHCRKTLLHQSGCDVLGDELVEAELLSNMGGRAERTKEGIVFYLFEVDDSVEALAALKERRGSAQRQAHNASPVDLRPRQESTQSVRPRPHGQCRQGHSDTGLSRRSTHDAPRSQHVTLVIAPPSRLAYVRETMKHLHQQGFPAIRWL